MTYYMIHYMIHIILYDPLISTAECFLYVLQFYMHISGLKYQWL